MFELIFLFVVFVDLVHFSWRLISTHLALACCIGSLDGGLAQGCSGDMDG